MENLILSLDGVLQVAVVGIPDPQVGYTLLALVVKKNESKITEQDVVDLVKGNEVLIFENLISSSVHEVNCILFIFVRQFVIVQTTDKRSDFC